MTKANKDIEHDRRILLTCTAESSVEKNDGALTRFATVLSHDFKVRHFSVSHPEELRGLLPCVRARFRFSRSLP